MDAAEVLGISVGSELVDRWRVWFAPPTQPFRTDELPPEIVAAIPDNRAEPTSEWRDTFFMYGGGTWTWLDEEAFGSLPSRCRRALLAARRKSVRPKKCVPVWPSELARSGDDLMFEWVASAVRPSRHREVSSAAWNRAKVMLPWAQQLAGTFPPSGSGANCFGNVMVAAGVCDADGVQIGPGPFQTWLDERTEFITGTEHDDEPGVVFVWTEHGDLAHATVTIGDGWMLSKPSQSWSSPRLVWTVREAVNSWRHPDTRLSRHRMLR
jgi:hypothetical protein